MKQKKQDFEKKRSENHSEIDEQASQSSGYATQSSSQSAVQNIYNFDEEDYSYSKLPKMASKMTN